MAATPKSQLEEDNESGAPQVSATTAPTVAAPSMGSTPSFGGTAGNAGSGGLAQQGGGASGQQSPVGTGFTNIDKVLGANKNAGKDLQASAADSKNTEMGRFNGGMKSTQDAIAGNGTVYSPSAILKGLATDTSTRKTVKKQLLTGGEGGFLETNEDYDPAVGGAFYEKEVIDRLDDRSAAIQSAQDAINQKYTGPAGYDFTVGESKDAVQLKGMSNAQTAGAALATKAGPQANYNTGLNAIDQAIFGSAGQIGAAAAVGEQNKAMETEQNKGIADTADMAYTRKRRTEGSSSDVADVLRRVGDRGRTGQGEVPSAVTLDAIRTTLGDQSIGQPAAPVERPKMPELVQGTTTQQPVEAAPEPGSQYSGDDAAVYKNFRNAGWSDQQAREMLDKQIRDNGRIPPGQNNGSVTPSGFDGQPQPGNYYSPRR